MTRFPYRGDVTIDPVTKQAAPNAEGQIFDVDDTQFSLPLTATDAAGTPIALRSNENCVLPTFFVEDQTSVMWKSGDFVAPLTTSMPIPGPPGASVVEVHANGDGTANFALSDGTVVGPVPLPAGPQGDKGPKGMPATDAASNDEALTEFATTPGTQFNAALSATIAEAVPVRPLIPARTPCESLAQVVDFASGFHRMAIAGDSTWNDGGDPPRKVLARIAEITPASVGSQEQQWSTSTNAYGSPIVVKAGSATPDTGGTVLSDNFNRTAAELVGSATSGGQTWAGNSTGSWSSNGTVATPAGVGALSFNAAAKDVTLTLPFTVVTTNTGTQTILQLHASSTGLSLGDNDVFAQIAVTSTGLFGFSLWKRIGGVSAQIGSTSYATGITSNTAAAQAATLKLQIAIQQVTATITFNGTDTVLSGTITETDVPKIGTISGVKAGAADGRIKLDSITMETPFTAGVATRIEFWNAAVPGTKLTYQHERLATMFPTGTAFDSLLVTGGHNNGTQTAAEFIAEVDAFITAFKAAHPDTLIVISSQNPQYAPSTTVEAHARRQVALRDYAMSKGYEYIPVFEAWRNQPDGGVQYIQSDGIHPTVSSPTISLGWSGSTLTASVWLSIINSRRQVGTVPAITSLP
ncbi:SGNH/GDSL hydrolase family protein [Arthrobacter sp. B1805]|uniref:SGNH/GDSL hydrolase family protein n=1 Tax=Arthrobacter sp. B1805 TaxID=2058892 RepID=UPI000CE3001B|nr:SGNH/GDSL hydrolase family protein [Arthrobacter sp. B1805]